MKNRRWFYWVGISVEFLILVLILSGCMKEPTFEQKFGDEISVNDVQKAISEIESAPASTIQKNEFYFSENSQQIETLQPITYYQHTLQAKTAPVAGPGFISFTLLDRVNELIDGQWKLSETEGEVKIESGTALNEKVTLQSQLSPLRTLATTQETPDKITFHNLKKFEVGFPVPTLVSQRRDCGGLSPEICTGPIPSTQISFDRVEWFKGRGEKISVLFVFSPHVPYFSSQLLGCLETMVPYEGQRVHVTQCQQVKDFAKGKNTP